MRSKAKRKDAAKTTQAESKGKFKEGYASAKKKTSNKIWQKKSNRVKLHHSFRRSYREDYNRPLHVPGLMHHAMTTLKILAKNQIKLPESSAKKLLGDYNNNENETDVLFVKNKYKQIK